MKRDQLGVILILSPKKGHAYLLMSRAQSKSREKIAVLRGRFDAKAWGEALGCDLEFDVDSGGSETGAPKQYAAFVTFTLVMLRPGFGLPVCEHCGVRPTAS